MEIIKSKDKKTINLINKKIICPTCKRKSFDPYTPFCSQKCSDIDLMQWLSDENYINLEQQ